VNQVPNNDQSSCAQSSGSDAGSNLRFPGQHDNCSDNFEAALRDLGPPPPPSLFVNVPRTQDEASRFEPPVSRLGDLIRFRAETDLS
jgi:uncharacterized protein YcgI (DUF1989 family)